MVLLDIAILLDEQNKILAHQRLHLPFELFRALHSLFVVRREMTHRCRHRQVQDGLQEPHPNLHFGGDTEVLRQLHVVLYEHDLQNGSDRLRGLSIVVLQQIVHQTLQLGCEFVHQHLDWLTVGADGQFKLRQKTLHRKKAALAFIEWLSRAKPVQDCLSKVRPIFREIELA